MKNIELLAPAGNFEALAAAVESGADAVYLGGNKFNARAFADNFDGETLSRAVGFAHIRGVRVFVTVNILLSDRELPEALEYIGFLYGIGADAIIVQDIALLKLAAENFPGMELHCSTQMTVHSAAGARYFASLGAKRIVLARELPLQEVREIAAASGVETEVFVHGALCVSYSGQCLMSSLIGGRSGNRGRCAQPCRRKYSFYNFDTGRVEEENRGKHILSTRDLNTYNRLEELVRSGVASLKIEGRMKKPEYVAIVVKHYRDALDRITGAGGGASEEADYELKSAFNREFTEGYLFGRRNRSIVSIERPDNRGVALGRIVGRKGDMAAVRIEEGFLNDGDGIEIISPGGRSTGTIISGIRVKGQPVKTAKKGDTAEIFVRDRVETGDMVSKTFDSVLNKKAREEYSPENRRKLPVSCRLVIKVGEYPIIAVEDSDGNSASYTGEDKVEAAVKTPTSAEKVVEQLGKTGDTPYLIEVKEAEIDVNCFMPVKQINRLRREVLQLLSEKRREAKVRLPVRVDPVSAVESLLPEKRIDGDTALEYIAGVRSRESAESALEAGADTVYLLSNVYKGNIEADAAALSGLCSSGKSIFYVLPNIVRQKELERLRGRLEKIAEKAGTATFGLVLSGAGQQELVRQLGIERFRINYSFNIFNAVAASHLAGEGAEVVGLSPELTLHQIRAISSRCPAPVEVVVYGYMPVMTTEYCPMSMQKSDCNQMGGCKASNYGIIDEKRKIFRLVSLDSCRTQLLNSDVLLLAEELGEVTGSGVTRLRGDFYFESPEEIESIIKLYRNYGNMDRENRRILEKIKAKGFTKGHFYRGVE
ncbi:MAG TPA: DUF3656 domain-containing protein [Clostridia bacterium]|nr:DUF3656 domain-containing protein [Clostridia bacterium]